MGNMKKRIALLATAVTMAVTTFAGCATIDKNATLMTIGEDKVTLGVANFYARYQQAMAEAQYGMYMGDNMWETKVTDTETFEENLKASIVDNLKRMYVLEDHMKDYNVELSKEDNKKIADAAKAFVEKNSEKVQKVVSGDEETVTRVLTLFTIQEKMRNAMIADVDTNVTDEEAKQKSMQYVFFGFSKTDKDGKTSTMNDEEKAELKTTVSQFLEGAKKAADFEAYAKESGYSATTKTFGSKSTIPSEELVKEADLLKEGELTGVIETKTGYYVAKVTSLFDKDATEAEKESIVAERQNARFTELVEGFLKDVKAKVDEKQWEKVSFTKQKVSIKAQEQKTEE